MTRTKEEYMEAIRSFLGQTKSAFMPPADPNAMGGGMGMPPMPGGPMPGGPMPGGPMPGGPMPGGDMGMGGLPPEMMAGLGGLGGLGGMTPPPTGMEPGADQSVPAGNKSDSSKTVGNLSESDFKDLLKSSVSDAFDRVAADLTSAITDLKQELRSLKEEIGSRRSPPEGMEPTNKNLL